jgi:hypothetical protein
MSRQDRTDPKHLPVVQPDSMLREHQAGPLRTTVVALGAVFVVALVLYGLTQPREPEQTASAPASQTTAAAPATTGQSQQANAPQQGASQRNANQNATAPTTTGQGPSQGQPAGTPKQAGK